MGPNLMLSWWWEDVKCKGASEVAQVRDVGRCAPSGKSEMQRGSQ